MPTPTTQISEQYDRTRPPVHQTSGQSRAGILLLPNGLAHLEGLRDDADDPEGTSSSRWSPGPSQVRRQPVRIGCLTRLIQGSNNLSPMPRRFLQQNRLELVSSAWHSGPLTVE